MLELVRIQNKLKANKGQFNSFGKYAYRSCEDILEALKPLLEDEKCFVILSDEVKMLGSRFYIEATAKIVNQKGLIVEAKASAREAEVKKGMDSAQITGATSSYARKYALNGLFAIDDAKDADTMDNKESERPIVGVESDHFNRAKKALEDGKVNLSVVLSKLNWSDDAKEALADVS